MDISSNVYLEILEMCEEEEEAYSLEKINGEKAVVTRGLRVDFDLKVGHRISLEVLANIPPEGRLFADGNNSDAGFEQFVTFNSMPDISSQEISKDAFLFSAVGNGRRWYCYSLFIQERNPSVDRNCLQSSLVLQSNVLSVAILNRLASEAVGVGDLTKERIAEIVSEINENIQTAGADDAGMGDSKTAMVEAFIAKHRTELAEDVFRCRSFLVVSRRPSLCSRAVEKISRILASFRYGGEISPYVSMCNGKEIPGEKWRMLGLTSEHVVDSSRFDNVIRIGETIEYTRRYKPRLRPSEDAVDALLAPLEAFFSGIPENSPQFSPSSFYAFLRRSSPKMKGNRAELYRDFLESPNLDSWLNSKGLAISGKFDAAE